MKILAIETSCDETAAAVIENGTHIISNVISSSILLHGKTGGIIPETAAREQLKYILPAIDEALKPFYDNQSSQKNSSRTRKTIIEKNIDAFAVTIGPGLIGSLLIGVETAKALSYSTGKPLIPVNHIFAHLYANWLNTGAVGSDLQDSKGLTSAFSPQFPAIGLVVSGGHTELFFLKNHSTWKWLGGTRDDAAGEAFDKTARLLELGYLGGPAIAKAARLYTGKSSSPVHLPRPMNDTSFDFSFSGLKTAVIREVNSSKEKKVFDQHVKNQLAFELQESITDVLVKKTINAANTYSVRSIILGGGVAANSRLTEKFKFQISNLKFQINLSIPPPQLCTDNAAYIGSYAFFCGKPSPVFEVNSQPNLEVEV